MSADDRRAAVERYYRCVDRDDSMASSTYSRRTPCTGGLDTIRCMEGTN